MDATDAQEKRLEPHKNVASREMFKNISLWSPPYGLRIVWSFEPKELQDRFREAP